MKKPSIIDFNFWNPFKDYQFKINIALNIINKDWHSSFYFEFSFICFQFGINFKLLYNTIKNYLKL